MTAGLTITERPPLRLHANITTPSGRRYRWAADAPTPEDNPSSMSFTTAMPGGFEHCDITLPRRSQEDFPDIEELSDLKIRGVGSIAWEGRIEASPRASGDDSTISPGAVGYQSHLNDDGSARMLGVDLSLPAWQGPSTARQIALLQGFPPGSPPVVTGSPSVGPDFTTSRPSLVSEIAGSWTELQTVEAWYDAHGLAIGRLYAAWQTNGAFTLAGAPDFDAACFLSSDDIQTAFNYDGPLSGSPGSTSITPTFPTPWAALQFSNYQVPGGKDGVTFDLYWTCLAVYGDHGLPRYGTEDFENAKGLLASDLVGYAVQKFCPLLQFTTGSNGSIHPSAFIIEHFAFLDATTVSSMIAEAVKYELLDWAIWENRTFCLNARGARGHKWRARIGPAQLQPAGPQISRLWNGVIVAWNDVSGVNRTIGPPGSGCNFEDASLLDTDPLNPLNQIDTGGGPLRKWTALTMGTSTQAGALQIGQQFLIEQRLLDNAGQATLTGWVEDQAGLFWPSWLVRAGDSISFVDAHDHSSRRIVSTSYDHSSRSNSIQLDQPPDSEQALLERLSVSLSFFGGT